MAEVKLEIDANVESALEALDQLKASLAGADPLLKQRLEALFESADFVKQLFRIQVDVSAAGAHKAAIRLEPADRFGVLLAAVVAGDIDRVLVH